MEPKSFTLETSDKNLLAATLFEPEDNVRASVAIGSALGVPRYFYFKFAGYLAEQGFAVLTFDYRGIHESKDGSLSGSEMRMEDWGKQDIDAALGFMAETYHQKPLVYVAHSCGGQLVGLAPNSRKIDAMVFVACQSGYWKHWSWPYRWGVWFTWHSLPLLVPFFDYIPARLMGISSVNLPSGVAQQWAAWGKRPGYLFDPVFGLDTARYPRFEVPLLAYTIADDAFFAPAASVEALLEEYPNAEIDRRVAEPGDYGQQSIGHFGFFKEKFRESLWEEAVNWMNLKNSTKNHP